MTIVKIDSEQLGHDDLVLDGFLVSPKMIQDLSFYHCGIRGYSSDDFSARWELVREVKRLSRQSHIICEGEYIVSTEEIDESVVEQLELTPVRQPRRRNQKSAEKRIILEHWKDGYNLLGFHRNGNKIRSNAPLLERGVFRQYLEYDPKVLSIGGRHIIRPNARCVYERTDSCLDQLKEGVRLTYGTKLRYRYRPKTCVLRETPNRTISDPLDESGTTLIDWYEQNSVDILGLRGFLPYLRENPEMPVLEVDHDHFNQGKNTKRFSVAALLLSQAITIDDIPEGFRRQFMQNSHVDMAQRMDRCKSFRNGLGPAASSMVDFELVSSGIAGLTSTIISEPNLKFGDGEVLLKWDPVTNYRSLLSHGPYRLPENEKRVGLAPFESTGTQFLKNAEDAINFLRRMKCRVIAETLDPWTLDKRSRANEFDLRSEYGDSDCDAMLVEISEFSEQVWVAWKRALTPSGISSQMVTRRSLGTFGVPFNLAMGLLSALGGLPFGLATSYTGVQVWIGMDTWREGRKNVSAASVVCNADGLFIGYPHPVITAGERIDDKAFEEQLRIAVEGVFHHYEQLGEDTPKMFGLIRDGRFFENPRLIELIEQEYGIGFVVCDIQKIGAPKLAIQSGDEIKSAESGTLLWNGSQGYIQTTEQRRGKNTGTPNLISVGLRKGEVHIEDLLKDLFWLTNIHAGSTQQPGIPVPQHYAHKIAQRAGKGVAFTTGFQTDLGIL